MDLNISKTLNDSELHIQIQNLARKERSLTVLILEHLHEVEVRRLFAKRGYSSLFSYCVECLGYSESAAQRRISSMRLIKEVPQVKEKIKQGKITLSNLSRASTFFRQEKKRQGKTYTSKAKENILGNLEGKTQKEAEKTFIELSPESCLPQDYERPITDEFTELRFSVDKKTMCSLKRLKELKPHMSHAELLQWMLNRCLKQVDPMQNEIQKSAQKEIQKSVQKVEPSKKPMPQGQLKVLAKLRRPLAKRVKVHVWQSAQGKCQFKDHQTGRTCPERGGLEVDHIKPLILGGNDEITNLRLLCLGHHQLVTANSFG